MTNKYYDFMKMFRARGWMALPVMMMVMAEGVRAADFSEFGGNPLRLPVPGEVALKVLSPNLLEVALISREPDDPEGKRSFDFERWEKLGPKPSEFHVTVDGQAVAVEELGFRKRVRYAPLKEHDLRVGNSFFLKLASSVKTGQEVKVSEPSGRLWPANSQLSVQVEATRWSPVIHVNQVGYLPGHPKKAMVGYYLGNLGEMDIPSEEGFQVLERGSGQVIYRGKLTPRREVGYSFSSYQKVWEADFSEVDKEGGYQLLVPRLGVSYPFRISEGVAGVVARTYALGLYHQRCGMANQMPWTRFGHDPCHTLPADVPTSRFGATQKFIEGVSSDYSKNSRHQAPQLKGVESSLYPYVNQGKVDVSGGHHDAGDYSKYTINSAALIHYLVFAADVFEGAGELDNLGIPESGDGKSDLLQEAKWEADFLGKMQDKDGGFYFLVYPKDRKYEDNVTPDQGDPQVVWPKTTSATAASVAALAQIGSSPRFQRQFPEEAAASMEKAKAGWHFLEKAIGQHGWDGSYQKLTHYGDTFMHDDELAWAAAEMFAATGEEKYEQFLKDHFQPEVPGTRRWTWWRSFEGYGCALRSYVFSVKTGRLKPGSRDKDYARRCAVELVQSADDQYRNAQSSSYGTSLPLQDKSYRNASWYFSLSRAFDLAVGYQIQPLDDYLDALMSNLNYELGCNPVNVSYVTGLGWKRQREIVHQYAQNDRRVLPPTGIPLGNVQKGFYYFNTYRKQLGALTFPPDWHQTRPYPFYDRWGDSFNVRTEFTIMEQGRGLATAAFLMGRTRLTNQVWHGGEAAIRVRCLSWEPPRFEAVLIPGENLPQGTQVVWESRDQEPVLGGTNVTFVPFNVGRQWVEAEVLLPDGRRLFARSDYLATNASPRILATNYLSSPTQADAGIVALFPMDTGFEDAVQGKNRALRVMGNAVLDPSNLVWMKRPQGRALRVFDVGDEVSLELDGSEIYPGNRTKVIALEAMMFINQYRAYGVMNVPVFSMSKRWDAQLELVQDKWAQGPVFKGGNSTFLQADELALALTPGQWHRLRLTLSPDYYAMNLDDKLIFKSSQTSDLRKWASPQKISVRLGNFDGWIDDLSLQQRTD